MARKYWYAYTKNGMNGVTDYMLLSKRADTIYYRPIHRPPLKWLREESLRSFQQLKDAQNYNDFITEEYQKEHAGIK